MRALQCTQLGSFDISKSEKKPVLVLTDLQPARLPDTGAFVRVKVAAAALNFADALQIQGQYQEKPKLPFVPGSELSGEVVEVSRDVRSLKVGDQVCAVTNGGAFATECVLREQSVLPLPRGVDLQAAAGLPVAFGTSHLALKDRANVQPGQTVLVLGAAGGVGLAAVQIAKVLGATVIAVARGAAKADALRALGADHVIDTATQAEPLAKLVRAAAPKGVDVLYDPVGGGQFQEAFRAVKWGGHVLFIGFASGQIPKVAANLALVKNLTLHGIYWGAHMQHRPWQLRAGLEELVTWLAQGKITVNVSHRFALAQYSDAFRALLSRQAVGKVLLLMDAAPTPQSRL